MAVFWAESCFWTWKNGNFHLTQEKIWKEMKKSIWVHRFHSIRVCYSMSTIRCLTISFFTINFCIKIWYCADKIRKKCIRLYESWTLSQWTMCMLTGISYIFFFFCGLPVLTVLSFYCDLSNCEIVTAVGFSTTVPLFFSLYLTDSIFLYFYFFLHFILLRWRQFSNELTAIVDCIFEKTI